MNDRMRGLDGLRALAIVWVMLFHSWIVGGLGAWNALATPGWMGVDLFFVLSGFLIGSQVFDGIAHGRGVSFADFYIRRAFRILPAFLVVLAVYVAMPALRENAVLPPAWMFLTFTHNLVVDYAHAKAFSHAWSLCVEEHFYLVFPTLALLLWRRCNVRRFAVIAVALVLGGMVLRAAIWTQALAPLRGTDIAPGFDTRWVEWIYYPTWCRLDGLLFGVLLAATRVWRPAWWQAIERRNGVLAIAGAAGVLLSVALCSDRNGLLASVIGFPLVALSMAVLVASGAAANGWISRLTPRGAGWIAAASYSLYLSHKLAFVAVERVLPDDAPGIARFVATAAAALLLGAALHYAVERPGLALRRAWFRRRAPINAAPTVAS